jgi:hypothetical protein
MPAPAGARLDPPIAMTSATTSAPRREPTDAQRAARAQWVAQQRAAMTRERERHLRLKALNARRRAEKAARQRAC